MANEPEKVLDGDQAQQPAQPAAHKPLSKALKGFYGVGDFGFNLMSSVETYYYNFFLTNLAMFTPAIMTMVTTVASTVDALLSWVYGAIINSVKPFKWGRYRSWLVLLPWIVPFLYAFQFIRISDNIVLAAVLVTIFTIVSHIAWNVPYVANVSMIAVAGKTPEDRARLASTRAAWSNAAKIVFSYIVPPLAVVGANFLGEQNQYGFVAFILGVAMAVLYFVHFKMFDGYEETETDEQHQAKKAAADKDRTSGKDLAKALFTNGPLMVLMLADLAKWAFNFTVSGIALYYFTYVSFQPGMLAMYILISNVACVVGSYLAGVVAKGLSTRTTTILAFLFMAAVMIVARLVYTNMWAVIILMSLAQLGYGIAYACTPALYADTIVYSEWKTGKNATGWISGLQNVPLKIGVVLRGIIIGAILGAAGFTAGMDASTATPALQAGICTGFMVIPAILLVVAAVLLLVGFRITREKVVQYQAEIDARNAAQA